MTKQQMNDLRPGDMIRHRGTMPYAAIIVTANYGDRVTAVRTFDITNPIEWELVVARSVERIHEKS